MEGEANFSVVYCNHSILLVRLGTNVILSNNEMAGRRKESRESSIIEDCDLTSAFINCHFWISLQLIHNSGYLYS